MAPSSCTGKQQKLHRQATGAPSRFKVAAVTSGGAHAVVQRHPKSGRRAIQATKLSPVVIVLVLQG